MSTGLPLYPASPNARVLIHYQRLPGHERIYDQRLVHEREDVIVTLSQPVEMDAPMVHEGHTLLERGSLALWFTFPGAWHDIGLFHRADGSYTGMYANVLTPPRIEGFHWYTTDLFLDLWWPHGGEPTLLDEDEFEEACARGQVDAETALRAREEADRILALAVGGSWPPPVVGEWSLERASAVLERSSGG